MSFGDKIIQSIKNNDVEFKSFESSFISIITNNNEISDYNKNIITKSFRKYLKETKNTINVIESHLCFLKSVNPQSSISNISSNLCKSSLGYYLANNEIKDELLKLFLEISNKINDDSDVISEAKSMSSITSVKKIKEWLANNITEINEGNIDNILERIFELFISLNNNLTINKEICFLVLKLWTDGKTNIEIFNFISDSFHAEFHWQKIEKICSEYFSYALSFLVGNIIDVGNDCINCDIKQKLQLLQKRIKYGLPSQTCIYLYEKGVCDRVIVQEISNIINTYLNSDIETCLRNNRDNIMQLLLKYPSIFEELFNKIID